MRSVAGLAAMVWCALLAVASVHAVRPPAPKPEDAPATEFSALRARHHLETIAAVPHPVGSAAHTNVRQYLLAQFRAAGLDPQVQESIGIRGQYAVAARVSNVVARLEGTSRGGPAVMLAAHYDSVPAGPGAGDDGSGVAALLETLRALQAGPPLERDVIFLVTDAEEVGLVGAAAFAAEHPWARDVGLVLNFEARGNSGPSTMFETSEGNGRIVRELFAASPDPMGSSLTYSLYKKMPNDTDLTVFKAAGMRGLNFAFIGNLLAYHTPLDSVANLDLGSLQQHGDYALAITRRAANMDLSTLDGSDAVYFDVVGRWLVVYGEAWAIPLALLATVLFAGAVAVAVRRHMTTPRAVALGAVGLLLAVVVTLAAGLVALWVIEWLHGTVLPAGPVALSGLYAAALVTMAAGVVTAVYTRLHARAGAYGLALGALAWWIALADLTTVLLPGASWVFLWPAMGATVAFVALTWLDERSLTTTRTALVLAVGLAPAALLLPALAYQFFVAFGIGAIGAPVLLGFGALSFWLFVPLLEPLVASMRWSAPVAAAVVVVVLFVAGATMTRYNTATPMPSNLDYLFDADTGHALWAARDDAPNAWTSSYLTPSPERGTLPAFFPYQPDARYLWHEAPAIGLLAPRVDVLADTTAGATRSLRFRVTPSGPARLVTVIMPGAEVRAASVAGRRFETSPVSGRDWALTVYAPGPDGVEVALEVAAPGPKGLRVIASAPGLPVIPGASLAPRPPDTMPVHSGDSTVVTRTVPLGHGT